MGYWIASAFALLAVAAVVLGGMVEAMPWPGELEGDGQ